jgi:Lon protease-like protein
VNDTSPDIEKMVRERLMAMSGAERFRIGSEMFDAARRMVLASFPDDLSDRERKRLLFERVYGERLPGADRHSPPRFPRV